MLGELPFELLAHIARQLPTAQAFYHLSLTCRKLHDFVKEEGWRIFVQERFPSITTPHYWKDAAHGLSTLSRNWDRKALVARYLKPGGDILNLTKPRRETQWHPPQGQTMGFQPVIDAYEEWSGNSWTSRREVLAFSAGAELVLRIKETGSCARQKWKAAPAEKAVMAFDEHKNRINWVTYKPPQARQGTDDITALQLLGSITSANKLFPTDESVEAILIGTARGDLRLLQLPINDEEKHSRVETLATFSTGSRIVRSADISTDQQPLIAAALGESNISIYDASAAKDSASVIPLDDIDICAGEQDAPSLTVWSNRWLTTNRLGVGLGPTRRPLRVYQVRESGIEPRPIKEFARERPAHSDDDAIFLGAETGSFTASIHSICPLPVSSHAGHEEGEVFLSGGSDGVVRLHDTRSPLNHEHCYWNPIDDGAIYSLQTLGRERLAVGNSQHSVVKFFDLRVSGGRAYDYTKIRATKPRVPPRQNENELDVGSGDWNLFLGPRAQEPFGWGGFSSRRTYRHRHYWRREDQRAADSPIYSLRSPSPCSPSLFAGLEGRIVQIDFTSTTDRYPDPIFEDSLFIDRHEGCVNGFMTWNRRGEVIDLAMYEHNPTGAVHLKKQAPVGDEDSGISGLDPRWRSSGAISRR